MKKTLLSCVVLASSAFAFIDGAAAAAPSLGGGWTADTIDSAGTDSLSSPYLISLLDPAVFSITDAFFFDDTFYVYNYGLLILTTSVEAGAAFPPSNFTADEAWESGWYSIGSLVLPAGDHEITIRGDGAGGVPATFFTRMDYPVPELGSTVVLMGLVLAGMGAVGRKLK